jgi:dUTP pyrophosphatase
MVILINLGDKDFVIKDGDRIAQMVFSHYCAAILEEVEEVSESERGIGGFGSTGV